MARITSHERRLVAAPGLPLMPPGPGIRAQKNPGVSADRAPIPAGNTSRVPCDPGCVSWQEPAHCQRWQAGV